ncbi:MAG: hypothetical protein M1609_03385 [Firmicutes bacterium]|nr:hypothetical protein [Bacillota bacterium]
MYFLGVDGGQTGTRAALVSADGQVVDIMEAEGLLHILALSGSERITTVLTKIKNKFSNSRYHPCAVFLSLTGVEARTPSQAYAFKIAARLWPDTKLAVESDGLAA